MWATARPTGFESLAELNRDVPSNTNWSRRRTCFGLHRGSVVDVSRAQIGREPNGRGLSGYHRCDGSGRTSDD